MTDQTIPADKVRKLAARFRQQMEPHTPAAECEVWECAAEAVEALIPAPPRPTLADMTPAERRECRRMQADVKGMKGRRVITYPGDGGEMTQIMLPNGLVVDIDPENVTPRPDLPRWELPGDQNPAPVPALPHGWRLADHRDHGRVIVTTQTPNAAGNVYFVIPDGGDRRGHRWRYCPPDELTYLDQEDDQ